MSARRKPDSRASRVRTLLYANPEKAFSLREIRDAIDPACALNNISGTLATMAASGNVLRVRNDVGRPRFKANHAQEPVPQPAAVMQTPPPPTAAARQAISGLARAARAKPPRASTLAKATNFQAAPGTADNSYCPKRAASSEIARDIAAFKRQGGRIQKLGTTMLFHTPADLADHDD
jgi:hypothetical protein